MSVAKGQRQRDGSYLYTCGTCHGLNPDCGDCYGGDSARIVPALRLARGQRYYALLKAFLSVNGKLMVDDFKRVKELQADSFTLTDMACLSLKFELNFKATYEWISEATGEGRDYDDFSANMKASKLTVARLYDAARQKCGEELTGLVPPDEKGTR